MPPSVASSDPKSHQRVDEDEKSAHDADLCDEGDKSDVREKKETDAADAADDSVAVAAPGAETTAKLSLEEEEVHEWETSGEMHQVVGSQSLLSQELSVMPQSQEMEFRPYESPAKTAHQTGLILTQELNVHGSSQQEDPKEEEDSKSLSPQDSDKEQQSPPLEESFPMEPGSQATNVSHLFASQGNSTLGPLLDAIQLQEEMDTTASVCSRRSSKRLASANTTGTPPSNKNKRLKAVPSARGTKDSSSRYHTPRYQSPYQQRQPQQQHYTYPTPKVSLSPMLVPPRYKKNSSVPPETADQAMAAKSAALAARVMEDAALAKSLLLRMALARQPPSRLILPPRLPRGGTIPDNFVWAHYPPLEQVLKDNMADYYDLSLKQCQSQEQQTYNNRLVELIREEASDQGWLWAPKFDSFKILRDRVRCYYKTHIQNAKKRLRTMLRNPTKRANARHLQMHWDLLQETIGEEAGGGDGAREGKDDVAKAPADHQYQTSKVDLPQKSQLSATSSWLQSAAIPAYVQDFPEDLEV